MTQFFHIHPDNPQQRLIRQAAEMIHAGGIVALPTDSSYALACHLDDKAAVDRLRRIRGIDDKHHLTLLCRDLSDLATYARVDNSQYRLLKAATPGPYTFILEATREVPRRLSHPSRKTIGLRVPEHAIAQALLGEHDFSAFRAAECQAKSPVRTMHSIRVRRAGDLIAVTLQANAFLHHMVRNVVGSLIQVGNGNRPSEWMAELLAGRDRELAAPTFSPDGLYLAQVDYDARWGLPVQDADLPFFKDFS